MLFLGTKAFPDEGGFEQLVGASSGSNNAYTASEDTNCAPWRQPRTPAFACTLARSRLQTLLEARPLTPF